MTEKAEKVILFLVRGPNEECGELWEDPVLYTFDAIVRLKNGEVRDAYAVVWFDVHESKPRLSVYLDSDCLSELVDISDADIETIPYSVDNKKKLMG